MSDNPFAEPDDSDRTVIRPAPGGRRPPAPPPHISSSPAPATAMPPRTAAAAAVPDGAETLTLGVSPLTDAAAPLLQLLARLRNTLSQPDTGELRERAVRELRAFEQRGRDTGVPLDQLRPAHYALCASLDDAVLNTPWGSAGGWDSRSLVSTFHEEVRSGQRFFDLLGQMNQNPGAMLPVIELMYLCMALGMQGRYRLSPRGASELDKLREETYAIIVRQRAAGETALSPHWQGVAAPYRPRRATVPVWVVGSVALAALAGLFVWFSTSLNAASDELYEAMLNAPPARMPPIARIAPVQPPPPPPAPPEPGELDHLRSFLKPEIEQGLVTVVGTDDTPIVRIRNTGLFPSGSAALNPRFAPLIDRIGAALKQETGSVQVIGYTDNQPIHTVQFPSNFQLSTARAQAAATSLAGSVGDAGRIRAEGRADADPIASNTTAEGREQNRRIEIVLHRQS